MCHPWTALWDKEWWFSTVSDTSAVVPNSTSNCLFPCFMFVHLWWVAATEVHNVQSLADIVSCCLTWICSEKLLSPPSGNDSSCTNPVPITRVIVIVFSDCYVLWNFFICSIQNFSQMRPRFFLHILHQYSCSSLKLLSNQSLLKTQGLLGYSDRQ